MPTIQTPPHAQILNPPKSRQEMPSSVEQNAFDRPPLALSLFPPPPPPPLNDICALPQAAIWKQLARERLHRAKKNTSIYRVHRLWRDNSTVLSEGEM